MTMASPMWSLLGLQGSDWTSFYTLMVNFIRSALTGAGGR